MLVLVRHAAPEPDPAAHPALWPLSDAGRQAARELARDPLWASLERIFTSPAMKALETAHIIAGPNGLTVTVVEDLHEVECGPDGWIDPAYPGGYAAAVAAWFAAPEARTHGWEAPAAAAARIRACFAALRALEPSGFAVAGHGLTLALSVAALTHADPARLWPAMRMPDVAIVDAAHGALLHPFGSM